MIQWQPFDQLPGRLKGDGTVLLWADGCLEEGWWSDEQQAWLDNYAGQPLRNITDFAEINPPERRG
jgi:hypothetical protein